MQSSIIQSKTEWWNNLDVNRDGKISSEEFDSSLKDSVEDTKINNRNGKFSPKELDSSLKESVEDTNIIKVNADIDIIIQKVISTYRNKTSKTWFYKLPAAKVT